VVVCDCHAEPAYWSRDPRYAAGGFWSCAVRKRARERGRYLPELRRADKAAWAAARDRDILRRVPVELRRSEQARLARRLRQESTPVRPEMAAYLREVFSSGSV
jgi:hypothetical protein